MRFCEKCGRPLEERTQPTGRFSASNGKPTFRRWQVCPEWQRRNGLNNGHSWIYGGDHNTLGERPDTGLYQGGPNPPEVA